MTPSLALPCSSVVTVNALLLDQSLAECRRIRMPQVAVCSMATRVLLGSTGLKVIWIWMLPVFFCVHNDWWLTEDSAKGTVDNRQYSTTDSAFRTMCEKRVLKLEQCVFSQSWCCTLNNWLGALVYLSVLVFAIIKVNKLNKKHQNKTKTRSTRIAQRKHEEFSSTIQKTKQEQNSNRVLYWESKLKERVKKKRKKNALWLLLCAIHADSVGTDHSAAQSTWPVRGYRFSDC